MSSVAKRAGRVALCMEMIVTQSGDERRLHVVVSIEGREGTLERSWTLKDGRLDTRQLEDVACWAHLTVEQACLAVGVQSVLF